jgi:hypothetical protein
MTTMTEAQQPTIEDRVNHILPRLETMLFPGHEHELPDHLRQTMGEWIEDAITWQRSHTHAPDTRPLTDRSHRPTR